MLIVSAILISSTIKQKQMERSSLIIILVATTLRTSWMLDTPSYRT
jgi:hypothetical protein